MSRNGYHGCKWVSIKKLIDPGTLKLVRTTFEAVHVEGLYYDTNLPKVGEVADRIRRRGVSVKVVKRRRDCDIMVLFFPRRVPVCGTLKGFFWRLYS